MLMFFSACSSIIPGCFLKSEKILLFNISQVYELLSLHWTVILGWSKSRLLWFWFIIIQNVSNFVSQFVPPFTSLQLFLILMFCIRFRQMKGRNESPHLLHKSILTISLIEKNALILQRLNRNRNIVNNCMKCKEFLLPWSTEVLLQEHEQIWIRCCHGEPPSPPYFNTLKYT